MTRAVSRAGAEDNMKLELENNLTFVPGTAIVTCHVSRVTCHVSRGRVVPPDGALVDVLRLPGGRVHGAGGRGWQRPALDGGDGGARQHRGDTLPCNTSSSHHILTILLCILFVVEPG